MKTLFSREVLMILDTSRVKQRCLHRQRQQCTSPRGTEVSENSEFLRNCVAVPIYRWFQPVSRPCRSHPCLRSGSAKTPCGWFSDPSKATGFRCVQEMEDGLVNRMLLALWICQNWVLKSHLPRTAAWVISIRDMSHTLGWVITPGTLWIQTLLEKILNLPNRTPSTS